MSTSTPSPFQRACRLIGSYSAVGAIFEPPVSPQGVAKWNEGVPGERVIKIAQATRFTVTPHDLRPDLYPNTTDGLPPAVAGLLEFDAMLVELQIVRPDERAALVAAYERGEEHLAREVEALGLKVEVRQQLLAAAQRYPERVS